MKPYEIRFIYSSNGSIYVATYLVSSKRLGECQFVSLKLLGE